MLYNDTQSQGDTQPASPWVYDFCTNNNDVDELGVAGIDSARPSQAAAGHASSMGHIDLLAGFEQPSAIGNVEHTPFIGPDDDDIDPLSQDVRAEIFPESKRFQMPLTPASQGAKRKRGSQGFPDETQTPSLPVNPFANRVGSNELLRPSQLFKATQAVTSPLNALMDVASDRPSPELLRTQRPSTAGIHSTPVKLPRSDMVRAATEPQTTYVSMKESQEARERRLQALEKDLSADELSDEDFDSVGTQLRKKFNRKQINEAARTQFAGVMARSQPTSGERVTRRRRARAIDEAHSSPLRVGRQVSEAVLISDDLPAEEILGNVSEDETEHEDEVEEKANLDIDELAEENKENVEVPMTVSRLQQATSQSILSQPTPSHYPSRKSARISRANQSTLATSSPTTTRSPERVIRSLSSSQAYAIVDSQSSQQRRKPTQLMEHTQGVQKGPSSSLDSRTMIPQSQTPQLPKSATAPSTSDREQGSVEGPRLQSIPNAPKDSRTHTVAETRSTRETRNSSNATKQSQQRPINQKGENIEQTKNQPDMSPNLHSAGSSPIPRNLVCAAPSNNIPSPRSTTKSASQFRPDPDADDLSGPSTSYETAKSRIIDTPSKSRVQSLQHMTRSKTSSPAKSQSQPLRTMQQIAADPSPPDAFGEIELGSILSREELEDRSLLVGSSPKLPTPKRRRTKNGLSLSVSSQPESHSRISSEPPGTPEPPAGSDISMLTPPQVTSNAEVATEAVPDKGMSPSEGDPRTSMSAAQLASVVVESALPRPRQGKKGLPNTVPDSENATKAATQSPSGQINALHTAEETITENVSAPAVVAPNRVFAQFNGSTWRYYPATCTGVIPGAEPRYQVCFDDGAKDTIGGYGIRRLEFRPGDICKVEMQGVQTKNFVVMGTMRSRPVTELGLPSRPQSGATIVTTAHGHTDVFGNDRVLVSAKQRLPASGESIEEEPLAVPLAAIYFTQSMWRAIKDREYTFMPSKQSMLTGLQTPSERPSTPSTPSSRARRVKSSGLASSRSNKNVTTSGEGLFDGMVFTLTNIAATEHLERTKAIIEANNGRILDNGFDELFNISHLPHPSSTSADQNQSLRLTASAKTLGFTCLIADRHCRRAKYIQALALGIPCLATRWVSDCVSRHTLLPLSPYLLPAGESSFLNGAVRSRVLDPLPDPTAIDLSSIFSQRPQMLADTSILLIMQKHEEQTMKHHNFLTHALGAARVAKVSTSEAAAKAVADAQAKGEPWDWVYTHDRVKETEKAIFGSAGGKRRKQCWEGERGKTRVVGNEFVIQSLILGQLADV